MATEVGPRLSPSKALVAGCCLRPLSTSVPATVSTIILAALSGATRAVFAIRPQFQCPIAIGLGAELDQRGGGVDDDTLAPLGPVVDGVDHTARKRSLTVLGEGLEHPFGFRAEVESTHDRLARELELERR